jgi:DNA-binding LacI/PurR family transcriptional regulator
VTAEMVDGPLDRTSHRVTIREVARRAGVSVGTVSLALADSPVIAPNTKLRVQEAAAALHYRPSALGRALQSRRTNAVALIVPHSSQHVFGHLYFMEVLSGVSEVLNAAGMTLVLSTTQTEIAEEEAYAKILHSQMVDGVILASAALNDKNIASLQLSSFPFVFIGRYPLDPGVRTVSVNDEGGARQAVRHLTWHGHTRIAHISGPLAHLSAADRLAGYRAALAEAGIEFRPEYCWEGDYSEEAGRRGTHVLLSLDEPPTAIFAANDDTAIGVADALRATGRRPGIDFALVGFDDVMFARLVAPPLTTVHQPMRGLGSAAAQLLLALLNGGPTESLQVQLPTRLVVRGSCGCSYSNTL